jgi:hypothetical protein
MNYTGFARALTFALFALFLGAVLAHGEESSADNGITISNANFVATSPEKENLNDEWVEITNLGGVDEDLTGWTLEDAQNHTYTFKSFTLNAGSKVKLHTGQGNDSAEELYWNKNTPIWNNSGDVATLKDASENIISSYPKSEGA